MAAEAAQAIDLDECAREPIHTPGNIQPHGALLAVASDLTVAMASENLLLLARVDAREVCGQPLRSFVDAASWGMLEHVLSRTSLRAAGPLAIGFVGLSFEAILHRAEGMFVIEIEPPCPSSERYAAYVRDALNRMQDVRSVQDLLQIMAREVKVLTGYDRVMIYRFHEDAHGEVVAEVREPELDPYLGLHYPASDIPAQARALYLQNRLRLIRDVQAPASPLFPEKNPSTGQPLDLGGAWLRGVSPVHIAYLTNMNVRASLSISLVHDGRLFGLIACHHRTPRSLSSELRYACEHLSRVASFQIELLERHETAEEKLRAGRAMARFIAQTNDSSATSSGLTIHAQALRGLLDAEGVAVLDEDHIALAGQTPRAAEVERIADWLVETMSGSLFHTDSLALHLPWASAIAKVASGILATSFAHRGRSLAIWFRPEIEQTVTWAGNPDKPVTRDPVTQRLRPRASFEAWRETVRGSAKPWRISEIEAALEVRAAVVEIVLRRTAELSRLNSELQAAVRARDEFLSMASHELRTPIATLRLTLDGLARTAERRRDCFKPEDVVSRIEMAMRQLDRTASLVDQLLDVSFVTSPKARLALSDVDLGALVERVVARLAIASEAAGSEITVRAEVGIVGRWDEARLDHIVTNLLSNAIKYGAGKPIEIEIMRLDASKVRLAVLDHGIGIALDAQQRIFERFERAVSSNHYGGFGVGLWIVRQFVDQMGGRVSVDSVEGEGSTFTVILPIGSCPIAEPASGSG